MKPTAKSIGWFIFCKKKMPYRTSHSFPKLPHNFQVYKWSWWYEGRIWGVCEVQCGSVVFHLSTEAVTTKKTPQHSTVDPSHLSTTSWQSAASPWTQNENNTQALHITHVASSGPYHRGSTAISNLPYLVSILINTTVKTDISICSLTLFISILCFMQFYTWRWPARVETCSNVFLIT